MRKMLSISILFLYFSLSAIQVISVHFCHGNLESIEIFDKNPNCCDSDHTDHNTCCNDISIEIDFDSEHIYSKVLRLDNQIVEVPILFDISDDISVSDYSEEQAIYPEAYSTSPPPKLFVQFHSLIFYG